MKNKLRGSVALLIGTMIWGSAFIAQSVGMDHIGPMTFQTARCLLGAVFLVPVVFLFEKDKRQFISNWKNPKLWKTGLVCSIRVAEKRKHIGDMLLICISNAEGLIILIKIILFFIK